MSLRLRHLASIAFAVVGVSTLCWVGSAGASRSGSSSAVEVAIKFSITAGSGHEVGVQFTPFSTAFRNINDHAVVADAGALTAFGAYTPGDNGVNENASGWDLDPDSTSQTVHALVNVSGWGTTGTPITGTAQLHAGDTMTASVNNGPSQPISAGQFSLTIPATTGLGANRGPSIAVSPRAVNAGRRVTVSGTVAGLCARGDAVTLLSRGFAGTYRFAGIPAVYANLQRQGRFAVSTRIPATRKPGRYAISGRCGGGELGVIAHVRVMKR